MGSGHETVITPIKLTVTIAPMLHCVLSWLVGILEFSVRNTVTSWAIAITFYISSLSPPPSLPPPPHTCTHTHTHTHTYTHAGVGATGKAAEASLPTSVPTKVNYYAGEPEKNGPVGNSAVGVVYTILWAWFYAMWWAWLIL